MRMTPIVMLVLAAALPAAESPRTFPLWDGLEAVADYARRVNLPPTETLDLGDGVKLELVLVPAGTFIMGTPEPELPKETVRVGQSILASAGALALGLILAVVIQAIRKRKRPQFSLLYLLGIALALSVASYGGVRWHQATLAWQEYDAAMARYDETRISEKPAHPVTITKPYYVGKFEVTQSQYQAIIKTDPSRYKGTNNPVETVSWDDAKEFCKQAGTKTGRTLRLLTEAEWEFACRAGTRSAYYSGSLDADLYRVAWIDINRGDNPHYPVGQKEPNAFGLYDVHGNIWEWCQDWYEEEYYAKSPAEDPQGPTEGKGRVLRGGSWESYPRNCRSSARGWFVPHDRDKDFGFRVVLVPAFRTP